MIIHLIYIAPFRVPKDTMACPEAKLKGFIELMVENVF